MAGLQGGGPAAAGALLCFGAWAWAAAASAGGARAGEAVLLPEDAVAAAEVAAAAPSSCQGGRVLTVGVVAELERSYVRAAGSPVRAKKEARDIMREVARMYREQMGVRIEYEVEVSGRLGHNYRTNSPRELLEAVRARWGRGWGLVGRQRGAVLLFTGKDLEKRTIGIAYQDAVCGPNSYAVTQIAPSQQASLGCRASLVAHELAHLLHVRHRAPSSGGRASQFVMQPTPSCNKLFSAASRRELRGMGVSAALRRRNRACVCGPAGGRGAEGGGGGGGGGGERGRQARSPQEAAGRPAGRPAARSSGRRDACSWGRGERGGAAPSGGTRNSPPPRAPRSPAARGPAGGARSSGAAGRPRPPRPGAAPAAPAPSRRSRGLNLGPFVSKILSGLGK